jgi:uncharacterized membrane protein YvbJ
VVEGVDGMKCPKCGTENTVGRVLCSKCGTRLRAGGPITVNPASPEAAATLRRWLRYDLTRLAIVVAVVTAAAFALGTILR